MYTNAELKAALQAGKFEKTFLPVYGAEKAALQPQRYTEAVDGFTQAFGARENLRVFSAPGRTEIGGNHTDHNHGRVLAASVNLDVIAVVSANDSNRIRIQSKGYPLDSIQLDDLSVHSEEENRSAALIRGVAARFQQQGLRIGGFDAYTTSDVLKGSGLSSSAAFEVLVGTIFNHLYNDGSVSAVEIAKYAQYAENVYFGKPSGLMDQMASSVGGVIAIDFKDPENPVIEKIDFAFDRLDYAMCVVDTGGNHADLTGEYAAIPQEMKQVAKALGSDCLRKVDPHYLMQNIPMLREKYGDRAVLRSLHFMAENLRVQDMVHALRAGNFEAFQKLVIASGRSSFEYLQNVYTVLNIQEQGLSLALCLAESLLEGRGAWRVHGGGFAGTTQNYVPLSLLADFTGMMTRVFGENSCHILQIGRPGGIEITAREET